MSDVTHCKPMFPCWRRSQRLLGMLLVVVVLMQTLGVMHRVAHASSTMGSAMHGLTHTSTLTAAWGEHSNAKECLLFDQSCPDLLHMPLWTVPPLWQAAEWVAVVWRTRLAGGERFYVARGPPDALM